MNCPLCATQNAELFFSDTKGARADFLHCGHCDLIFKSPEFLIDEKSERDRYALHNNVADDGYVRFLKPALTLVETACPKGSSGLDYGCGPGPVLSQMLSARGYAMHVYDPYFANDRNTLEQTYDFVTCTEVAEHFYKPDFEFARLMALLAPGGRLIVMTGVHRGRKAFKTWHYRIDPTHVCFYSVKSLTWIAARFNKQLSMTPSAWPIAVFS